MSRYMEKLNFIDEIDFKPDPDAVYYLNEKLEKEILRSVVYADTKRTTKKGKQNLFCVYNNLKVYCVDVHKIANIPQPTLRVQTCYEYNKHMRGFLCQCERCELTDFVKLTEKQTRIWKTKHK